jgi:hypothetical protein
LETSTEILDAEDLHLEASLNAITTAIMAPQRPKSSDEVYDLQGRRVVPNSKGIYIKNKKIIIQ